MALLNFPENPANGQVYPDPCPPGVTQYRWDSTASIWRIVGVATGVTPGTYGSPTIVGKFTVDAAGSLSYAENVPIQSATISQEGIVQLTNSTASIDQTKALSARGGKALQDQIGNLANCIVPDHTNVVAALNDLQLQATSLEVDALKWCGYYNAQEGDIIYVSITGQRQGYIIGQELPVPNARNGGDFFIVTTSGNPYIAGDFNAPDEDIPAGDWIISEGSRWSVMKTRGGVIKASDVQYTPTRPLTSLNVQGALDQVLQLFRTGIGGCTISPTKPPNPYPGQLWWDSDDGLFYVFYTDINGSQWVEAGGGGSQSLSAGGGSVYLINTGVGLLGGPITTEGTIYLQPAFVNSTNFSASTIGGVIPHRGFVYSNTTGVLDLKISGDFTGKDPETAFSQEGANILNSKIEALSGGNVLAGTYDANLGVIVYATPAGQAKGFTPGSNVPPPSKAIDNYYVIVTVGGNVGPSGVGQRANPGDWYICQAEANPPVWFLIDYDTAGTQAVNVSVTPIRGIEFAGNVQRALEAVELQVQDRIEFAEATTDGLQIKVSAPKLDSNDGTTLSIGVDYASVNDRGIVQLTNDYRGNSQTIAPTQYAVSLINSKVDALVGANVLAGTYNSNTGQVVTVTPAGEAAGFTPGAQAPEASRVPDNYYLIVTVNGGYGPPGAVLPPYGVQSGDWFVVEKVADTSAWITIDYENRVIDATQVNVSPIEFLSATNVQVALEQLQDEMGDTIVDIQTSNNGLTLTKTPLFGGPGYEYDITLNAATTTDIGGVFVAPSNGLTLAPSGGLSLTVASPTQLGGIKVGQNLSISSDGTLNAEAGGGEAQIRVIDSIASQFNGIKKSFNLTISTQPLPNTVTAAYVIISVGGVLQSPGNSYSLVNGVITFTEAPPTNASFSGRAIISIPAIGGAGGVQAIEFVAPLTGGIITETGTVGIVDATPTQRGAMSAAQATKLAAVGSNGNGNKFISTAAPKSTDGVDGDIWYQI